MANNTIAYTPLTEKDFYDLSILKKRDLVSTYGLKWTSESPTDPGVASLRIYAYLASLISKYFDATASQNYLIYAESPKAVHATCRQLGYKIKGPQAAVVLLRVEASGAVTIPVGAKVTRKVNNALTLTFETVQPLVFSGAGVKYVYAVQGETKTVTKTATGENFEEILLNNYPVARGSIVVISDSTVWTQVDDFVNSTSTSTHYTVEYDYKGQPTVICGDGVFGKKFTLGSLVVVSYRITDGSVGNIAPGDFQFTSSYSKIISVTNFPPAEGLLLDDVSAGATTIELEDDGSIDSFASSGIAYIEDDSFSYTGKTGSSFTGVVGLAYPHAAGTTVRYAYDGTYGIDAETNKEAKISAIRYNRLKGSCVSLRDYEQLIGELPSIARIKTNVSNNVINIQVIPADGGIPSTYLFNSIYSFLTDKKGALHTVSLQLPNYVYVDVEVEVAPASGYSFANYVKPLVEEVISDYLNPVSKNEAGAFQNYWGAKLKKNLLESKIFNIGDGGVVGDVEITMFKRSTAYSGNANIQLLPNEIANVGTITVKNKDVYETSYGILEGPGSGVVGMSQIEIGIG